MKKETGFGMVMLQYVIPFRRISGGIDITEMGSAEATETTTS